MKQKNRMTDFWEDIKSNGAKNPRAKKQKKLSDREYLDKIAEKDNMQGLNQIGSSFESQDFNDEE